MVFKLYTSKMFTMFLFVLVLSSFAVACISSQPVSRDAQIADTSTSDSQPTSSSVIPTISSESSYPTQTTRTRVSEEEIGDDSSAYPPPMPTERPLPYPYPISSPTSSLLPTPTFIPVPSPTPTRPPTFAPMQTFLPSDLDAAAISAMVLWQEVETGTEFVMRQISDTPNGVSRLEWSPNGQNLLLEAATGHILMGGGSNSVPLIVSRDDHSVWSTYSWGDTYCMRRYDWSPDGQHLAFIKSEQLRIADSDGQTVFAPLLPGEMVNAAFPLFSPDGRQLAISLGRVEEDGFHYDIWTVDVASGLFEPLIENAGDGDFVWSPSGNALAHLGEGQPANTARIWIADINSGQTVFSDLAPLPGVEGCLSAPIWLVGENEALATVLLTLGVWVIDLDGNVERLDQQHLGQWRGRAPGLAAPLMGRHSDDAIVSPDGRYVVYTSGGREMYVIDWLTGNEVSLNDGDICQSLTRIAWSPVGSSFLCWNRDGGHFSLVNAVDGSSQVIVTDGMWPAWSPDGSQIAYWQFEEQRYSLWLMNLDDMQPIRLILPVNDPEWRQQVPFSYDMTPQWSPDGQIIAFVADQSDQPEAYIISLKDSP